MPKPTPEDRELVHGHYNAPLQYSVRRKRWVPKLTTNQTEAMINACVADYAREQGWNCWPKPYPSDGRVVRSLVNRGWLTGPGEITELGREAMEEFFPDWVERARQKAESW